MWFYCGLNVCDNLLGYHKRPPFALACPLIKATLAVGHAENWAEWVAGPVKPPEAGHRNINHFFTSGQAGHTQPPRFMLIVSIDWAKWADRRDVMTPMTRTSVWSSNSNRSDSPHRAERWAQRAQTTVFYKANVANFELKAPYCMQTTFSEIKLPFHIPSVRFKTASVRGKRCNTRTFSQLKLQLSTPPDPLKNLNNVVAL